MGFTSGGALFFIRYAMVIGVQALGKYGRSSVPFEEFDKLQYLLSPLVLG